MKKYLSLLVMLMMSIAMSAEEISGSCGTDVTYTLDTETGVLTIEGTGAMSDYSSSSLNGTYVTTAPWGNYYQTIKSVTISQGVTSIGTQAFYGCSSLTSITIPSGVTSIRGNAFRDCSSLTSITIPESVTSIGGSAFQNCSSLTSITIPEGVTRIEYQAFSGCSSLTSIDIPNSVTYIGTYAFSSCKALTSISLPFVGTSKDATTPTQLTVFGAIFNSSPADGFTATNQYFRSGTSSSSYVTYYIPSSLSDVNIKGAPLLYGSFSNVSNLHKITLGEGVTSIDDKVFYNCSGLTSIDIPKSIESISSSAFSGCSKLEFINIKDLAAWCKISGLSNVTRYGLSNKKLLIDDEEVTDLIIPSGVTMIPDYCFRSFSNIKSVEIPSVVTSIGSEAFSGCSKLEFINIKDLAAWCKISGLYNLTRSGLSNKTLLIDGEEVTDLIIPSGVTMIPDYCFQSFSNIKSVEIPSGVTSMGNSAFYDCSSLTSITIPEGVTSIGSSAFSGCSSLTSITIPEGVTSIERYTFDDCSSLTSITIPEGVTSIESSAFGGCTSLPVIDGLRYADTYLVEMATDVEDPREVYTVREGTRFMSPYAFSYCETLKQVSLPESLQTLCSFEGCTNLTSINIPSLITELPSFYGCKRLKEMTFSEGCQISSYYAQWLQEVPIKNVDLSNCTNLYDVSIDLQNNNVIEAIKFPQKHHISGANITFVWCNNLKSIDLGYYEPSIDDSENVSDEEGYYQDRFDGNINIYICDNLEEIFFGNFDLTLLGGGVTSIAGCPKLKRIGVSSNVADLLGLVTLNGDGVTFTEAYYPFFKGLGQGELYIDGKKTAVEITFSENIEYIGAYTYYGMKNIERINIPSSVTSIGMSAFENCTGLSVASFDSDEPLSLESNALPYTCSIVVPDEAYDTYVAAWPEYATQIVKRGDIMADLELEADPHASALDNAIGQASSNNKITNVIDLKIKGTINSYDIMMIRNMMTNLHNLDLSEAKVVDCEKEYWDGYHSENDILGSYAFSDLPNLNKVLLPQVKVLNDAFAGCTNLAEVVLPEGLEVISDRAFAGCTNLSGVTLPASVRTIGKHAFDGCANIGDINIPEGVKEIGDYAFHASGVAELTLPESLKRIGDYAFANNTNGSLKNLQLPPYVETIGESAFENCSGLEVININPMVKSIGDKAFLNLAKLKKVYTYTLEPINIAQTTFDRTAKAALYVPEPSFDIYYNDNKWSRFATKYPSNEEYEFKSVYLNNDYVMTDETGIIGDQPDAELYENSALVNNASETQAMSELHVKYDGDTNSASVFGNITAEKVSVEIPVDGRKWYFFSFPFDIELRKISCSDGAQYVWRKYDGDLRAQTGTGWTNLTDATKLCAGEGYIFQASDTCMLTLLVDAQTSFEGETVEQQLAGHTSQNAGDAGWNYVGTPFLSYYDIDDLSYDSPITIWNAENQTYEAIRPGDDDVTLHPFQAFFVQATGEETLTFDKEKQETGNQAQTSTAAKARARKVAAKDDSRLLINLELTNGTTTDKTRVVFNEEKSLAYEANCDAAKFMATGVPQLYTICDQNKYAINERPYADGTVRLGFVAEKAGSFSIQATRMDTPCLLKDTKTGKVFDLTVGSYDFESEAGSFDNRFLLMGTAPTALDKFMAEGVSLQAQEGMLLVKGASQARIYNAAGALVAKGNGNHRLAKGTYIVEMGERSAKIVVK